MRRELFTVLKLELGPTAHLGRASGHDATRVRVCENTVAESLVDQQSGGIARNTCVERFQQTFVDHLLDGGHLLFYAIEAVRGRPLSDRAQEWGIRIGMALVGTLMVFVTWKDIVQL